MMCMSRQQHVRICIAQASDTEYWHCALTYLLQRLHCFLSGYSQFRRKTRKAEFAENQCNGCNYYPDGIRPSDPHY
jgi:hypothetical protein